MVGNATVWDDLRVPLETVKLGGNDPGYALFKRDVAGTSRGVFVLWFDPASIEECFFSVQLPHSWAGTAITPHVHWTPATTADGNPASQKVEWGLEYTWAEIGADFSVTSTIYGKDHYPPDANVVAGRHYITDLTVMTPSSIQDGISSMILCRLFRNATDATDDTYEADAGLLEIDFHYEINSIGSREILAK
jgi:hypothetical protein